MPDPCRIPFFSNLNALGLQRTYAGFKSRAGLSWKPDDDVLLYYTWSQGFRPGGFNRGTQPPGYSPLYPGQLPWQTQARQNGGWSRPIAYAPDSLTNNELGWKTTWLGRRVQWNGALYREDWDHAQIGALDADVLGGAVFNGGAYRLRGIETFIVSAISDGLTLELGAAWNHNALVREATLLWANGQPIDFSLLQTYQGQRLSNPEEVLGSPLAGAPGFQANGRLRYEIALGGYSAFMQLGAVYQSHSLATSDRLGIDLQGSFLGYDLPPCTTYDGALGVRRAAWIVQLYAQNLTDTRAQLYSNYSLNYKAITVNRPRTVGLRMSYAFQNAAGPET